MHKYGDRIRTLTICSEQSNCRQKNMWYLNSIKFGQTSPGDLFRTGAALYHPRGIESHRGGTAPHRLWTWWIKFLNTSNITCNSLRHFVISSFRSDLVLCFCHEAYVAAKRIEGLFFLKESQLPAKGIVSFLPEAKCIQNSKLSNSRFLNLCKTRLFKLLSWPFKTVGCFVGRWRKIPPLTFPTSSWTHERQLCLTKHPSPGRQRSCGCPNDIEGLCRFKV